MTGREGMARRAVPEPPLREEGNGAGRRGRVKGVRRTPLRECWVGAGDDMRGGWLGVE